MVIELRIGYVVLTAVIFTIIDCLWINAFIPVDFEIFWWVACFEYVKIAVLWLVEGLFYQIGKRG